MEEILLKQRKKYILIKNIATIILIMVIIMMGLMIGYRVSANGGGMRGITATILGHDEHTVEKLEKLVVLIVGESEGMTDTIIVATYNPKTQTAEMLSIPRDTYIRKNTSNITASNKINAVYSASGIDELVNQVEKITDKKIPYYIKVNTKGLRELVDLIDGVDFDVPIKMDYDDNRQNLHIHLKKGYQHINGAKAEQLVRFRHNNNGTTYNSEYGDNDFGRMRTGRDFLKSVLQKTIKIGNVLKIKDYIDLGSKYVETNVNIKEIKDYVPYILDFDTSKLKEETLSGKSEKINGIWFFIADYMSGGRGKLTQCSNHAPYTKKNKS